MPSSTTSVTSLLSELYLGRTRWDLLRPFPSDESNAAKPRDELSRLLREWIDPEHPELTREFMDALQDNGLLRLTIDPALGGLGLSALDACRVIEVAAAWSAPVAFALSIANGFGSGTYLPVIPDGPLHELIARRVREGIVSAGADAEPTGTANQRRTTVAVPTEDGYLLTGEKIFIGNGTIADLMDVSATVVAADGTEEVRLFFVDSRSPGFSVVARHEFMGLKGAEIGMLRLDSVRVPAANLLDESSDGWRMRPGADEADLALLANIGRAMVIAPMSLAVAKHCLHWSKQFIDRRAIDERSLGEYPEIKRIVATTAADLFTIESIVTWVLQAKNQPDLTASKNIASLACWRAVDRTMSLYGGEGYETAASKAARGAPPVPVERAFRDARALRIAGGVDFMLDKWSAESNLVAHYAEHAPAPAVDLHDPALTPSCQDHLSFVGMQSVRLAQRCRELTWRYGQDQLFARQRTTAVIGQIGTELLGMLVVLGHAAHLADQGNPAGLELADVACATARHRLAEAWAKLDDPEPAYDTAQYDFLIGDIGND